MSQIRKAMEEIRDTLRHRARPEAALERIRSIVERALREDAAAKAREDDAIVIPPPPAMAEWEESEIRRMRDLWPLCTPSVVARDARSMRILGLAEQTEEGSIVKLVVQARRYPGVIGS